MTSCLKRKVAFVVLRKSTSENVSQERSFVMSQAVRLPVNTRKEKKNSLGSRQATLPNFCFLELLLYLITPNVRSNLSRKEVAIHFNRLL